MPVFPVVTQVQVMVIVLSELGSMLNLQLCSGSGWQNGMRSDVFFCRHGSGDDRGVKHGTFFTLDLAVC